jgi:DNA-binding transcriptional LysR family regulator
VNITLKQLETFIWVADLGSFRKAADRLNTTQPNISSRIASLETQLHTVLMERDAGSVRLTSKGQALLEHARNVINSVEVFVEAADESMQIEGVLRVGVTEMIVHTWLRDFLKIHKQRNPNIILELTVDLSVNLEQELISRAIDIAFQSGPFESHSSGSEPLGTYPVIWVASPKTGLSPNAVTSPEDLAKLPILTHARNTQPYAEVAQHFAARPDLHARLVPSSNLSACLHMTIDGFGVAALLEPMVKQELKSGELFQVNYPWTPQNLSFFARFDAQKSSRIVTRASLIAAEVSQQYINNS